MIPLANPSFGERERAYVLDALDSGWVSSRGPYIARFEHGLSSLYGLPAVACSSGTGALHLALLAAGIGPGDDVVVPDVTFAATAAVVKAVGARPVLADIDGLTITAETIEPVLTDATRAIMPVHLYGELAPMDGIMALARKHGLVVIEDAAEVCQPYLPQGDYACFSFFANKQITTGEGGAVLTRHDPDKVRLWRDHGMVRQYHHTVPGLNYAMTNLQAAVGVGQLERYSDFLARRVHIWSRLKAAIPEGRGFWLYVVPKKAMRTVETRPIFDPLHTMPPYRSNRHFPNAERLWRDFVCLPCGPHLSDADVATIIEEYNG